MAAGNEFMHAYILEVCSAETKVIPVMAEGCWLISSHKHLSSIINQEYK